MELNSFWLISVGESDVSVSLIFKEKDNFSVAALGSKVDWSSESEDSFVSAIDQSLSEVSEKLDLGEEEEPELSAFVLSPFWVGSDGKIIGSKLKLIEAACKNLKLKPMGFIANDEAITEEANSQDGFPASFILINLNEKSFTLSLVYLGKIKERLYKTFSDKFNAGLIESALLEINSESALPPQIIIFGEGNESIVSEIKNFPWVGKKNIEVFLHFPSVKFYSDEEVINLFTKTIILQMGGSVIPSPIQKIEEDATKEEEKNELEEVNPVDLGFSEDTDEISEPIIFNEELLEPDMNFSEEKEVLPKIKRNNFNFKLNFKLPKISSPKFKKVSFWPFAFTPVFLLIPFFFSKADIDLFVTPYNYSKKIPVTLDSTANDLSDSTIPVGKKTFNITSSATIRTTGQKTVGEKSQGEIIIYNKLDKSQSLSKGSVLSDSTGKKFELTGNVIIPSSNSDLDAGIINLGQVKAFVSALDIGSEYNLAKGTKFIFKDFSENSLVAKVKENLSGGSKRQINAVSQEDKSALEEKINEVIKNETNKKIDQDLSSINGVIRETIQNKKDRIDYSREIGEEADELSASAQANVTVFFLEAETKEKIINKFLIKEDGFSQSDINPDLFKFNFKIEKIDEDKTTGILTLEGKSLPKINILELKQKISGKSKKRTSDIIKKTVARVYNFKIENNFRFLEFFNPIPFLKNNIKIEIKTELM